MGNETEENWCVDGSDDEEGQAKTAWEPSPEDIVTLYNKISTDKVLELEWKCPGRRSPSPEKMDTSESQTQPSSNKVEENQVESKSSRPNVEVAEFDFDDMSTSSSITPRRAITPASAKSGRSQKRVARMDNVLKSLMKPRTEKSPMGTTPKRPLMRPTQPMRKAFEGQKLAEQSSPKPTPSKEEEAGSTGAQAEKSPPPPQPELLTPKVEVPTASPVGAPKQQGDASLPAPSASAAAPSSTAPPQTAPSEQTTTSQTAVSKEESLPQPQAF